MQWDIKNWDGCCNAIVKARWEPFILLFLKVPLLHTSSIRFGRSISRTEEFEAAVKWNEKTPKRLYESKTSFLFAQNNKRKSSVIQFIRHNDHFCVCFLVEVSFIFEFSRRKKQLNGLKLCKRVDLSYFLACCKGNGKNHLFLNKWFDTGFIQRFWI